MPRFRGSCQVRGCHSMWSPGPSGTGAFPVELSPLFQDGTGAPDHVPLPAFLERQGWASASTILAGLFPDVAASSVLLLSTSPVTWPLWEMLLFSVCLTRGWSSRPHTSWPPCSKQPQTLPFWAWLGPSGPEFAVLSECRRLKSHLPCT